MLNNAYRVFYLTCVPIILFILVCLVPDVCIWPIPSEYGQRSNNFITIDNI